MDLGATITASAVGIAGVIASALGLNRRMDRLEDNTIRKGVCDATHAGITENLATLRSEIARRLEDMNNAARSSAAASQAAQIAAEKATELAHQYMLVRDKELHDLLVTMNDRIDRLVNAKGAQAPR